MKKAFVVLLVASLAGCATNKAVLPSLEGKPRVKINAAAPVVAPAAPVAATSKAAQPQINLLPPLGKPSPLNVTVNLRGATLDDVLREIGEQGGDAVDVVLNKSKHQGGNQVLVRFNNPKE